MGGKCLVTVLHPYVFIHEMAKIWTDETKLCHYDLSSLETF